MSIPIAEHHGPLLTVAHTEAVPLPEGNPPIGIVELVGGFAGPRSKNLLRYQNPGSEMHQILGELQVLGLQPFNDLQRRHVPTSVHWLDE